MAAWSWSEPHEDVGKELPGQERLYQSWDHKEGLTGAETERAGEAGGLVSSLWESQRIFGWWDVSPFKREHFKIYIYIF